VSARVRSLVVECYLGYGRCWFSTSLWPSNLSLDRRALVAASARRKLLSGSVAVLTYRQRLAGPGGRRGWDSLIPRDPPTPSQSPCYHSLVMGRCQLLGPSRPFCMSGAVQDVITPANFCEDRLRGFGVASSRIFAFSIDLLRRL